MIVCAITLSSMTPLETGGKVFVLVLLAAALHADPFDDLRLRWRETLTGGEVDLAMPQIRSRLASIESTARGYRDRMDKSAGRTALWSELASPTNSSHMTSSWRRLRDMALAWATPGQALYGDAGLLADVRSGMDWMDANRYNARVTNKFDNSPGCHAGTRRSPACPCKRRPRSSRGSVPCGSCR